MRKKRLILNTGTALLNQAITLIFGFVVPRLIISHYGSTVNGLVSSITQFLVFFSLMEMGVGGVVKAALYKPLAESDTSQISKIIKSARRFFGRISVLLCVYSLVLMIVFPLAIDNSLGIVSTVILVVAIALNYFAQHMFGMVNQLLLAADQKAYVQMLISSLVVVLNTILSIVLIELNASVEVMKLGASAILLLRPLLLKIYVDRHYSIDKKIRLTEEPLKQKWNALAANIANYIVKHADPIILTFFLPIETVSVYYVYHLVTNGLQQLIELFTTGMSALLGDMYARKEEKKLTDTYSTYEWVLHTLVALMYTIAGVLIVPFVRVYTRGVNDTNYIVPLFAILIIAANGSYCLRLPYYIMVQAAGHFKETQTSAILEASINVVVSVALVHRFGLVGVAFGTLFAMLYRSIYLAWYLSKSILYRPITHFIKHMGIDLLVVLVGVASTRWIHLSSETYASWILMAIIVTVIVLIESIVINCIFYKNTLKTLKALLLRSR